MVTAKDLRIGNLLWENSNIVIVTHLQATKLAARPVNGGERIKTTYSQLMPILVVPELLHHCDFEQNPLFPHLHVFRHRKCLMNIHIIAGIHEVSFGLIAENVAMVYQRTLHLHQLQNLYYALTGDELAVDAEKLG